MTSIFLQITSDISSKKEWVPTLRNKKLKSSLGMLIGLEGQEAQAVFLGPGILDYQAHVSGFFFNLY